MAYYLKQHYNTEIFFSSSFMSDKVLLPCWHSDFSIVWEFILVLKHQFPYFQVPCYTEFIQDWIYICGITEK